MEAAGSVAGPLRRVLTPVTSRALAVAVGERALALRRAGYRWRRRLRGQLAVWGQDRLGLLERLITSEETSS